MLGLGFGLGFGVRVRGSYLLNLPEDAIQEAPLVEINETLDHILITVLNEREIGEVDA